jgi:hypothetical protein
MHCQKKSKGTHAMSVGAAVIGAKSWGAQAKAPVAQCKHHNSIYLKSHAPQIG